MKDHTGRSVSEKETLITSYSWGDCPEKSWADGDAEEITLTVLSPPRYRLSACQPHPDRGRLHDTYPGRVLLQSATYKQIFIEHEYFGPEGTVYHGWARVVFKDRLDIFIRKPGER